MTERHIQSVGMLHIHAKVRTQETLMIKVVPTGIYVSWFVCDVTLRITSNNST
eukprot:CAMPEP_0198287648 /NCGR_PEP_ID=MMETSP1449-20131203/6382_1 /TAXON_ID=420275 /ORGANISM="Attheya septentrionalis, Strain CCMP2084" /LENGTH=52 /DNA_ID=CAMNT_0043985623 /DNA_START=1031 /DNA_END=1189 /DNA_ORIENTATION=-